MFWLANSNANPSTHAKTNIETLEYMQLDSSFPESSRKKYL